MEALAGLDVAGCAVLLHTQPTDGAYLTGAGAAWLVEQGAALVGIDSADISGDGPAHTLLLAAGIPVVERLTGLAELPTTGARFTVAPYVFSSGSRVVRACGVCLTCG